MLEQLIYTRCSPCRSLENGQVIRKEGLGFYSLSPGLVTDIPERIKLDRLIRKQNCSKTRTAGYVCSYSLLQLGGGNSALTYEVPRENTGEKRLNGNLIRTGNYIKQTLVGKIDDYPYKWFGSAVFDAHLHPQQDYYHDLDPKSEPPLLPQLPASVGDGYITDKMIDEFLSDGRKPLFKQMLAFVCLQLSAPVGERRVLLIKDTPEHTELWVAAIERSLSKDIALKVSFDTNISGITGNNSNGELFYYVNNKTGAVCSYDSRINTLERLPYAMIAGIHPKDTMSANIRKTPISNYEIADTANMSFTADMSADAGRAYFAHAAEHDDYISEFCEAFLPYIPEGDGLTDIAGLFDAYALLMTDLCAANKSYNALCTALRLVLKNGAPGSVQLCRRLFETGLAGYGVYFTADEENGYALLSLYSSLADTLGEKSRITEKIADRYISLIDSLPGSSKALCRSWEVFGKTGSEELTKSVAYMLFDEQSVEKCIQAAPSLDAAAAKVLFDMLFAGRGADTQALLSDEGLCTLTVYLLSGCVVDRECLAAGLRVLSRNDELFCFFAYYTARYLEGAGDRSRQEWIEALLELSGNDPEALCSRLCQSPDVGMELIESILCVYAKGCGRFEDRLHKIFELSLAHLGAADDTGLEFYRCCFELIEDMSLIPRMISKAMRAGIDEDVQRRIYIYLNKRLFVRKEPMTQELLSGLEAWSERLCISSLVLEKELFVNAIETVNSVTPALGAAERFIRIGFDMPQGYTKSVMFGAVCEAAGRFNDRRFYLYSMFLLDTELDEALKDTAFAFADTLIRENIKSKHLGSLLLELWAAFADEELTVPAYEPERVSQVRQIMKEAFEAALKNSYRSSMPDQVKKAAAPDEDKKALIRMLAGISGSKGGIKGIFRHK